MLTLVVSSEDSGQTLLSFLRKALTDYPSVKAIKRCIDYKQCTINGRVEFFSTHKVKTGDKIQISLAPIRKTEKEIILFEDEELIIFDKPVGKTSESFEGYFLVHRLDKETSGVFLMAKTVSMRDELTALFAKRQMEKSYLALCDGKIALKQWKIDNFLAKKVAYQGGALYGSVSNEKGKRAVTFFECLQTSESATLVHAIPITGRTHQIRVHLKEKKHPVLGDWQYSRDFVCSVHPPRMMLHALKLQFTHPKTHEKITLKAPIPKDFLEIQKTLFDS